MLRGAGDLGADPHTLGRKGSHSGDSGRRLKIRCTTRQGQEWYLEAGPHRLWPISREASSPWAQNFSHTPRPHPTPGSELPSGRGPCLSRSVVQAWTTILLEDGLCEGSCHLTPPCNPSAWYIACTQSNYVHRENRWLSSIPLESTSLSLNQWFLWPSQNHDLKGSIFLLMLYIEFFHY